MLRWEGYDGVRKRTLRPVWKIRKLPGDTWAEPDEGIADRQAMNKGTWYKEWQVKAGSHF